MTMANPEIIPVQAYDGAKATSTLPPPQESVSLDKALVVIAAIYCSETLTQYSCGYLNNELPGFKENMH